MAKIKRTKEEVIKAIIDYGGRKTAVCEVLVIARATLERYLLDPKIQEALDFALSRRIDRAEHKLDEAVERGESWAIMLTLKDSKRGKERGYGNSVELTGKDGAALPPIIIRVGVDTDKL
jgi:hypothetical protein